MSRALRGMTQDLLKDGRGATGLNPEGSCGVAEEVGERVWFGHEGKKKPSLGRDWAESLNNDFFLNYVRVHS
ncbi:MAG: hypothetical protein WBF13_07130 [Candidatus Zixiibacteriota bacterium]